MPSPQTIAILNILSKHRRIPEAEEKLGANTFSDKLCEKLDTMVKQGKKIRIVLPAFPEKSPVRDKTLSDSPDMAELISLKFLNELCQEIAAVYNFGAEIVIYTDGFAFAEVFPDIHTKAKRENYLIQLNNMIDNNNFKNIKIVNLDGKVNLNNYAETDKHFEERVKKPKDDNDINSLNLYRGQIKFFMTELSMGYPGKSNSAIKREAAIVSRGVARMSEALSEYLSIIEPEALRLSCHPKTVSSDKIGLWFTEDHSLGGTPWHNAAVYKIQGETNKCTVEFMKSSEARRNGFILKSDKNGNPSHFVSQDVYRYACSLQSFFRSICAKANDTSSGAEKLPSKNQI
ncbi:L-tyrosine/L-tryptophan isonitrile synthase family protein [Legionella sp. D16C41]|uniref:L-tyrosine/L-tryptophan isonitrile synthase family protein n=1 Tax=Legionella sp. D16C41 TaxID=3402688 RepID=UPI003AF9E97D